MRLTGEQIRAGRAMARMTQAELAAAAGVKELTIIRLEKTAGPIAANTATQDGVQRALEAAGVVFLPGNGHGPGVAVRKPEVDT